MAHSEDLLQYVWKYKLYDMSHLSTTDGDVLEVLDSGIQNSDAGPDFFNAKIKIGKTVWAGNIEIHTSSADWKRHEHHKDKAYNSVILHVAENITEPVYNEKGLSIPQFQMVVPEHIHQNAANLLLADKGVSCEEFISEMPPTLLSAWLDVLAVERLERKTADIFSHLQRFNNSWDEVLYVLLCRNFGFGLNSDQFERLALSLPYNFVQKHGNNLFQIEALLFGQAGMLGDLSINDTFYNQLQDEYAFLRKKYLLKPLDSFLFKKLRVRPNAFPQVRIAQFAALLYTAPRLFGLIVDSKDFEKLRMHLSAPTSSYWNTHYTFGKKSAEKKKYLGDASLNTILINTVAPILFAYGMKIDSDEYRERALSILESVPPERNAIVTRFKKLGITPQNAFDTQALIQLWKEYCNKKKCLYCKIGQTVVAK